MNIKMMKTVKNERSRKTKFLKLHSKIKFCDKKFLVFSIYIWGFYANFTKLQPQSFSFYFKIKLKTEENLL